MKKKESASSGSVSFFILLVLVFWGVSISLPFRAVAEEPVSVLMLAIDQAVVPVQGNPEDSVPAQSGPMLLKQAEEPGSGPAVATESESSGPAIATGPEVSGPAIDAGFESSESDFLSDVPPDQSVLYQEVRELRGIVDRLRQEAQAREHLQTTTEEERDKEAEILQAAGREYSLRPPYAFGMDLSVYYSYNDYDVIRQLDLNKGANLEYRANHTITNNLSLESGVRENLTLGATVPFVYKYDKANTAESKDVENLGDISLELKYQPLKTGRGYPSPILSTDYTLATGRSPYEINPATELATGSGVDSISQRISVSQPFDPVNAYGSLSYTHRFKKRNLDQVRGNRRLYEVDGGDSVGVSVGFGYAVSYRMSLSIGLSCTYIYPTDYYYIVPGVGTQTTEKTSSGDYVSASLNLSTSWRVTPGRTLIIGVGKGLTTANPGFSFSLRMPVSFDMR